MARPAETDTADAPACWRFAHARYDETRGLLWVREREVALERSGLVLLSYFLRHAGQVVHKDTLLEVGWSGRIVADNTLTKAIGRLRRALGDEEGQLLRVAHGYGYRLAAQVERIGPAGEGAVDSRPQSDVATATPAAVSSSMRWPMRALDAGVVLAVLAGVAFVFGPFADGTRASRHAAAAAAGTTASIAVLPFIDLSPKRDQGYFADGLAEELLDNLARSDRLRVASRTSSFAMRDSKDDMRAIGRKLDVRHVLEGSVRSSGGRIRVTVQLIDARDGFHVWSQTYDRPMSELFAMQDEIVASIIAALRIELAPEAMRTLAQHGTGNPEAFREYLFGKAVFDSDGTGGRRSALAFRRAVALDPQFTEAWLALADMLSYDNTMFADSAAEALANQREALAIMQRQIGLHPRRADLYLARGDMLFWHAWDLQASEQDYRSAARLGLAEDADWMIKMSRLYAASGRMSQALALTARATMRDPARSAWTVRAYHLLGAGRIDEARAAATQAVRRQPLDPHAHYYLGLCDLLQGRPREAEAHFDDSSNSFRLTGMALAEFALGHRAASDEHLRHLVERHGELAPYLIADVHAWRGDNDEAYRWMQRSVDVRDGSLMYLVFDPLIAPLRKDARWPGLLKQVGLERHPGPVSAVE